ncbi:hypothetical protein PAMC26577_10785 [Caballeronia sordidicola]|uniref:Uncharacterized protein n=1 Tax=Caballeronia sordidicola TaxID=196367 RepID=A0A242MY60_CABSO|nr:hypothetical protein PAMC26577_10785 [Caballeronia sordidicola]
MLSYCCHPEAAKEAEIASKIGLSWLIARSGIIRAGRQVSRQSSRGA